MNIKIAPSILGTDFARLGEQIREVEQGGANLLHLDVMDGHFVPNLSIGPHVVASLRKYSSLFFDVHLMVEKPDNFIDMFLAAGANGIIVHAEACTHLHRTLDYIAKKGARVGVALNPASPLVLIEEVLPFVNLVLIMSVNPGFGGQEFLPFVLTKVERLRQEAQQKNLDIEIGVDGGISYETAPQAVQAGATMLVMGTSIFEANISLALKEFRQLLSNMS